MIRGRRTIGLACCSFLLAIISTAVQPATGQTSDEEWTIPVNLSRSGGTAKPFMAVDINEAFHVFWRDEFAEAYYYTRSSGQQWSTPQLVTMPFEERMPWLIVDGNNRLQVFWLDEGDEELGLLQSSVSTDAVANPELWSVPVAMGAFPIALELAVDDQDRIHLVYAQAVEPAGVYHQSSDDGGISWSPRNPLYLSPYFRGLDSEEINLSLATSSSGIDRLIFVAWDLRPLKRVSMARSANGGQNWGLPEEIAGPESGSGNVAPFNIEVIALGDQVLTVWQTSQQTGCEHLYQWSDDRGRTWQSQQRMPSLPAGSASCYESSEFLIGSELAFLFSEIKNQVYIWAWDGSSWSDPKVQQTLSSFDGPDNFNLVVFRCRLPVVIDENQLTVVGCDMGALGSSESDIWTTSRELGSIEAWFPPPSAWSQPQVIASSEDRFFNLVSVGDSLGSLHTFWGQDDDGNTMAEEIYYAGFRENSWTLPQPVIMLPEPAVGQFDAVYNSPTGLLFLAWGDTLGQILFSFVEADQAQIASAWSPPARVPGLQANATSPSLSIGNGGDLYLVYTVPLNDDRGVYLVKTEGQGKNWSEPAPIFDGEASGWDVVGPARLTMGQNGILHILLNQQTIMPAIGVLPESVQYTYSEDSGQSFSEPVLMAEGEVNWNQIINAGTSDIHQIWQIVEGEVTSLEHVFSDNGGRTWSRPALLSSEKGPVAIWGSDNGTISVLQLTETRIVSWRWTDDGWVFGEGLALPLRVDTDTNGEQIAIANSLDGKQIVAFAGQVDLTEEGQPLYELQASQREVGTVSTITETIQPTISTPTISPTITPSVEVTATEVSGTREAVGSEIDFSRDTGSNSSLSEMLVSLVPVALIVAFVLVIGLVRAFWLRTR